MAVKGKDVKVYVNVPWCFSIFKQTFFLSGKISNSYLCNYHDGYESQRRNFAPLLTALSKSCSDKNVAHDMIWHNYDL